MLNAVDADNQANRLQDEGHQHLEVVYNDQGYWTVLIPNNRLGRYPDGICAINQSYDYGD
jgi:hypothetical protein